MLRAIAIDDEPKALDIVRLYADKIPFLKLDKTFRDALEALSYLKEESVDLIFLDINMPDLSGIEFLQSLTNPPMVIFTTAYSEYAVESYDYQAVDYLLKPITFTRFLKAVNKAAEIFENTKFVAHHEPDGTKHETGHLLVKSGTEMYNISYQNILYIEGAQNYVFIHTPEKKIISLMRMKEMELKLPSTLFFRIHKSFIIALKQIDKIEAYQVTIKNHIIPIGKIYKEAFLKQIRES